MSQDEDEEDFLFDDSCLWEQSDSLRQGEMLSCWIFSKEKSGTTTLLLDGKEYMIHDNAIGIMSFFEVYCNANRCCPQTVFSKQLGGYLHHLRELVCTEVRSTNRQRLQAPMWQPWSLRRWAVRVKHGFNHSPKACAMYMEYCAKKDWKPYQHDNPLLYDWALILNKYFPVNGLQEANTLISQLNNKPWLNAFDFIHLFLKRPSCICRAEQDCQFWKNKNKVGLMNGDELQLEKEFQHLIVNNLGYIGPARFRRKTTENEVN